MEMFRSPKKLEFDTSVALGCFDGVHLGHRKVISECKKAAEKLNIKSGVILFWGNVKNTDIITDLDERCELFGGTGIDFVYVCELNEEFKHQSPQEFADFLKNNLKAKHVCAGFNYKFGYKAGGDAEMLKALCAERGIDSVICSKYLSDGEAVSSSRIREALTSGRLAEAKKLLGYDFFVSGTVSKGFQNGGKLGFKTANIDDTEGRALPPDGVYAGRTYIDNKAYVSVINIGKNPTFDGKKRTIEAHLLDFDKELYGKHIKIEFCKFLRKEKHFDGIEELKEQISNDAERTRMEMREFQSVIMAAGMGTRMKSELPKVLHKVCGKSLVKWVLKAAEEAGSKSSCVIVGHKAELVKEALGNECEFALQAEQKGTGHAIMQAGDFISKNGGTVVILSGDTPLISSETVKLAVDAHEKSGSAATVISAVVEDSFGYGRIVRGNDGSVLKIVEQKDASEEERKIKEINSGMYVFDAAALTEALKELTPNNAQGEYYLTDTLEILLKKGKKISAYIAEDPDEIRGINDRVQLAEAEKIMQERINRSHMKNGVTMILPETIIIEDNVEIGADTVIYPNVILRSGTKIGKNCSIGSNTQITDSEIADNVDILSSVLLECSIDEGTHVGPFAYIRPNTHVGKSVRVGDFVELKNSNIDDGTKISHLTYVGDSDVGKRVNFGCGTVTVNYDGKKKYRTKIGDDCFIGCNTNLVAPVEIEDGGYTAAGSTITDTVPENALAIARARQVNKESWKDKRK